MTIHFDQAALILQDYAARLDLAAFEKWHGILNAGEDITAALRDLALRMGGTRQGDAEHFTTADKKLLLEQAKTLRKMNTWPEDPNLTPEARRNYEAGLALAGQLDEIAKLLDPL